MNEVTETSSGAALEVLDVHVQFEGVKAVDGVDLTLAAGEILGLIGPNGAGKTTLVNVVSGYQAPTAGEVLLGGTRVTAWSPQRLARAGLVRTFQAVRLFANLTVLENVEVAAVAGGLRPSAARARAFDLLEAFDLADRADVLASALPLGEERLLGIARALGAAPRFMLLDEPAAGLDEHESDLLVSRLAAIRDQHTCALLVIEHDMRLIMRLCERIQVLDSGRTISIGTPNQVRSDPAVLEAYLGADREAPRAEG
jgi:ABC-type branched-subunit amino acid transport system ATPase component